MSFLSTRLDLSSAGAGVHRHGERVVRGGADATGRKNLQLLIQLRWIAVAGQLVTIIVTEALIGIMLPIAPMMSVLIALVLLNIASQLRLRRPTRVANSELFTSLMIDVAALTLQFSLTGGATNPFTFLYLLQVILGAVLLDAWSTWVMVTMTTGCFAGLMFVYRPLDLSDLPGRNLFDLHIDGMLICFLLVATLLVVFVTRINGNLQRRDAGLAALRQHAAEEEHIVRMGLLATGAAHELGTPLSTLSVILGDWRHMPALTTDPELMSEITAMEAEVRRCKAIVTGILMSAGETRGESATLTTLSTFLDDLIEDWCVTRPSAKLQFTELPSGDALDDDTPIVSDTALKQVIVNVLDNAFEASPGHIAVSASCEDGMLMLVVEDHGPGFSAEILAQAGRPYQSSKGRPGGGLGLFLVFNVFRKLGGRVQIANRPAGGAMVTLILPLAALAPGGGRADVG